MTYEDRFKHYTVEQKLRDLMANPFFNDILIAEASDEDIIIVHKDFFETMNKSMLETIGKSIYDDIF